MKTAWWRRNLFWVVALVPLIALALLASSQRMINVYVPWHPVIPTRADEHGVVHFHQKFKPFKVERERTVEIQLRDVEPIDQLNEEAAVPGGQMWRFDLYFSAEPDQLLGGCDMAVLADGTEYGFTGGKKAAPGTREEFYSPMLAPSCERLDARGPQTELFSDEIMQPEAPRPKEWDIEVTFVLPEGVEPEELRVWWHTPEYASLPVTID